MLRKTAKASLAIAMLFLATGVAQDFACHFSLDHGSSHHEASGNLAGSGENNVIDSDSDCNNHGRLNLFIKSSSLPPGEAGSAAVSVFAPMPSSAVWTTVLSKLVFQTQTSPPVFSEKVYNRISVLRI